MALILILKFFLYLSRYGHVWSLFQGIEVNIFVELRASEACGKSLGLQVIASGLMAITRFNEVVKTFKSMCYSPRFLTAAINLIG